MLRFSLNRRVQIAETEPAKNNEVKPSEVKPSEPPVKVDEDDGDRESFKLRPSERNTTENQEPFMGVKVRRKASIIRDYRGDYLDVRSRPYLLKILEKQGDKKVYFADKVLKFTGSGKIKKRILLITDFAVYIVNPDDDSLKRRIALAAVEKLCLSAFSDNFFVISIPTEYDLLMASTRKTEIVTMLVEAIKDASNFELDVDFSNSFEYQAAADLQKEIQFEEVEGGVKTRITRK